MSDDGQDQPTTETVDAIPIVWEADDVVTRWANHFFIQREDETFILTFFELTSPFVLGTPAERVAKVRKQGHVVARGVARVAVSPKNMAELIDLLDRQMQLYRARDQQEEATHGRPSTE